MNARLNHSIPLVLIIVSVIPILGGILRMLQISGLPVDMPDSLRVLSGPRIPLLVHITASVLFVTLGAFQFSEQIRVQRKHLHRAVGYIVALAALTTGLSAIWLTLFFPHSSHDNELLNLFRITAGSALVIATFTGFWYIKKRNVFAHRRWMTRAYAIGAGTGLQGLVIVVWLSIVHDLSGNTRAVVFACCWISCLVIAEISLHISTHNKLPKGT